MIKSSYPIKIYSWIPNLTSKINFQYITEEINIDGDLEPVIIANSDDKLIKNFNISNLTASDNLEEKLMGHRYDCSGTLHKDSMTNIIHGTYNEKYTQKVIKEKKLSKTRQEIVRASFTISENGFIEIFDFVWNYGNEHFKGKYTHRQLGIYTNIKRVLHKDVHHDTKEDVSIQVYENEETYKDEILEQIILTLKTFERSIKDSTDLKYLLSAYKRKINQLKGYKAYLDTYNIILCDEAYVLKNEGNTLISQSNQLKDETKDDFENAHKWKKMFDEGNIKISKSMKIIERTERASKLADNIINSAVNIVEEEEKILERQEKPFLYILALLTLLIPAFIASINLLNPKVCMFKTISQAFFAALSYVLVTIVVGYYYTSKSIVIETYYKIANWDRKRFMKIKNEMLKGTSLEVKVLSGIIYIGAFITVILFGIILLKAVT